MKNVLLVTLLLFVISYQSFSQAPNIQWQKSYGGSAPDEGWFAIQTRDGGYAVSGDLKSNDGQVTGNHGDFDFWIIKVDSSGNLQWQKALGGSSTEKLPSIVQSLDGGFCVAGASLSTDGDITDHHGTDYDFWVVKLDSLGNIKWKRSYGGSSFDYPHAIINTSDGGFAIAGMTGSADGDVPEGTYAGSYDYWILKTDSLGTIQWQKTYGGSGNDWGFSIVQCKNKDFAMAGYTSSADGDVKGNHGGVDGWVIRVDSTGKLLWSNSYGTAGDDYAFSIDNSLDNGFFLGGSAGTDYWVTKIDSAGNQVWSKYAGGTGDDEGRVVKGTTDGGCVISGYSGSSDGYVGQNHGSYDYWVAKFDPAGCVVWGKDLGGSGYDPGYGVFQTKDEGYVVAGASGSNDFDVSGNHGGLDYWVVKLECAPPTVASAIVGDTNICAGSNVVFNVPYIGNATTYNWTLPSGASFVGGENTNTVTVHFPSGLNSGTITVNGTNKCGVSTTSSLTMNVAPVPVAGAVISSVDSLCEGTGDFSVLNAAGSVGQLQWQSSVDDNHFSNIPGASSSIYNTTGISQTTFYRLKAFNCSDSTFSSVVKVVFVHQSAAGSVTTPKDSICDGTGGRSTLTVTGSRGYVQWESSTDSVNYIYVANANDTVYNTQPITQTTWYRVLILNDVCGGDSSSPVRVRIVPSPTADFTYAIGGHQVSFNSQGTIGATTLHWDFNDGQTSANANPIHTFDTARNYYVCLTAYNATNCSFTKCESVDLTGDGIENINSPNSLVVYPNPAGNTINLSVHGLTANFTLKMVNVLGQEVMSIDLRRERNLTIDISSLAKGVYELILSDGKNTVLRKVVKE